MAKVKTIRIVKINLELTLEEAQYLLDLTQNFLSTQNPKDEWPLHKKNRKQIWKALSEGLK